MKLRPHLFNTSVATDNLTFYDDKRPENNQDQSKHVASVISFAENTYNKGCVDGINFLGITYYLNTDSVYIKSNLT